MKRAPTVKSGCELFWWAITEEIDIGNFELIMGCQFLLALNSANFIFSTSDIQ